MTYYKDRTANEFQRLLWFLLGGSRGGENRAKIVYALRSRPRNVNQLAKMLNVDYRSVQHHIGILTKNSLVIGSGQRYGMTYSIHPWLEHNIWMFDEICNKIGFSPRILEEDHLLVEV
ncbi:MAG: ArsR/SmtB family transcription factor [Nitrososphaerales archaeon]